MDFSKTTPITELVTHAVRAAEVSAQIDAINSVGDALADMLRSLSTYAHTAGLSVPYRVDETAEELHNLRENLLALRRAANEQHDVARTYLHDKEQADAKAYVSSLTPAELVALIRGSK